MASDIFWIAYLIEIILILKYNLDVVKKEPWDCKGRQVCEEKEI